MIDVQRCAGGKGAELLTLLVLLRSFVETSQTCLLHTIPATRYDLVILNSITASMSILAAWLLSRVARFGGLIPLSGDFLAPRDPYPYVQFVLKPTWMVSRPLPRCIRRNVTIA